MTEKPTTEPENAAAPERAAPFRWDFGGWFGSVTGGTLWRVLLSAVLLTRAVVSGLAGLVLAGVVWFVAAKLWSKRETLEPYPSIQRILLVNGLAALALFIVMDVRDAHATMPENLGPADEPSYLWLLVFPALMVGFHLKARSAR